MANAIIIRERANLNIYQTMGVWDKDEQVTVVGNGTIQILGPFIVDFIMSKSLPISQV